ncbi:hypothetical protein BDV95DRAFT_596105 [Massariosphaeria phaeospora]|uniref:mRNA export factor GLE1 n=1 Tax=Massariosphaeria phaeospora TaxID=100035 RepID=A0A7C8M621_9PLEO|nr:hypothetical protein BDV95DRAFT_596105 [Massariosphaeria phaeospora]
MPARSGTSSTSMHTASSFSSSWLDGSPSRQSPGRNGLRTPRKAQDSSPYQSPGARQTQTDYNKMLNRSDQDLQERLNHATAQRAKEHSEQLAKAAREHQRVQEGATLEIERLVLEQEHEKARRVEAQRQENERLKEKARQEAEAQRRKLEAEQEAARQAAEQQRKLQEAEARVRAQKEQEEARRRQKSEQDEANKKARTAEDQAQAAAAAQKARTQQPVPTLQKAFAPSPQVATGSGQTIASPDSTGTVEAIHAKYLELHQRMKKFRLEFSKRNIGDPLKEPVGNARRNLRKRLGQVTVNRQDSVKAIKGLREEVFDIAKNTPGPMVDIRNYIISHKIPQSATDFAYPAFLLYAFICFEKSLLAQFEKEAANDDGKIIQEVGLIAASLLADQNYMWNGIPMTDIVLAKLHRRCPILFGIRGNMSTAGGLVRLGLDKVDSANSYSQRMQGLGGGFAALSLRQFSGKTPAISMSDYWRAVVSICNTPSDSLYPGHFFVLKGLLRDYVKKFLQHYGAPARGVLRRATVDLPGRAPKEAIEAASLVKVLPDGWRKDNISLD